MTASMEAFSPSWSHHGTQRLSPLSMSTTEKSPAQLVSNQDIELGDQGFSSRRIRNFSSKSDCHRET
ncbi:hypothetical protein THAOC_23305 [Thalassiosira oceanica]|uniref:Uncharacterized protein n=1 Tax=Thalassiosira oceanica TaxID=159749 RepID=K0S792_THAOC|nr:hypothetical protein THAOC_23305 [Thalassiosira oceanica]|eukprot:EJK56746.1 hypothetical protein THAOC_23305 [Thalassiosira oceanica]